MTAPPESRHSSTTLIVVDSREITSNVPEPVHVAPLEAVALRAIFRPVPAGMPLIRPVNVLPELLAVESDPAIGAGISPAVTW